ncbi:MAG: ferritin-like domain-containing protein, partial [Chloroflexi bacterium]|nr:ferritin-like domain-containing protein [Chloroflexota bacterium]
MATTKEQLIAGLNQDLALELGAAIRYLQQTSMALGIDGEEVREILRPDIAAEMKHAEFLADKIVALGGRPAFKPTPFDERTDVKAMLEYDRKLEWEAV